MVLIINLCHTLSFHHGVSHGTSTKIKLCLLVFIALCFVPLMILGEIKWWQGGGLLRQEHQKKTAKSGGFLFSSTIPGKEPIRSHGDGIGGMMIDRHEEKNMTNHIIVNGSNSSNSSLPTLSWWNGTNHGNERNDTTILVPAAAVSSSPSSSPTIAPPVEVDKNLTSAKLCPNEDLSEGRWINVTYDIPPYIPMRGEVQQKTCLDFDPAKPFHTYIWEPTAVHTKGCVFATFDHDSFCQVSRNKTIAIIGDSISFDHYLSLSHLLGVPKALPKARNKDALLVSHICQNSTILIGKRDFYLHSVQRIAQDFFPDVLVLNRGAHYVTDQELIRHMNQTVFPQLRDWQQNCRLHGKDCMLIWRTSVPGHPNCTQYKEPSTSLEEMEQLVHDHGRTYHWDQFLIQNKLVLDAFKWASSNAKSRFNLTYAVMDAYSVNILRPDMHAGPRDCLHTCLPKDNTYSWLLHHMMLLKYD